MVAIDQGWTQTLCTICDALTAALGETEHNDMSLSLLPSVTRIDKALVHMIKC
jgi:hypothetical protein